MKQGRQLQREKAADQTDLMRKSRKFGFTAMYGATGTLRARFGKHKCARNIRRDQCGYFVAAYRETMEGRAPSSDSMYQWLIADLKLVSGNRFAVIENGYHRLQ
jgi:hypothetical protein